MLTELLTILAAGGISMAIMFGIILFGILYYKGKKKTLKNSLQIT